MVFLISSVFYLVLWICVFCRVGLNSISLVFLFFWDRVSITLRGTNITVAGWILLFDPLLCFSDPHYREYTDHCALTKYSRSRETHRNLLPVRFVLYGGAFSAPTSPVCSSLRCECYLAFAVKCFVCSVSRWTQIIHVERDFLLWDALFWACNTATPFIKALVRYFVSYSNTRACFRSLVLICNRELFYVNPVSICFVGTMSALSCESLSACGPCLVCLIYESPSLDLILWVCADLSLVTSCLLCWRFYHTSKFRRSRGLLLR